MLKNSSGGVSALMLWRIVLGVLVVANLIALWQFLAPTGGSAADVERQLQSLQVNLAAKRGRVVGGVHAR